MLFDTNHTYTSEQIITLTALWSEIIQHLSLHHDHKVILGFLNKCGVIAIDDKHKRCLVALQCIITFFFDISLLPALFYLVFLDCII